MSQPFSTVALKWLVAALRSPQGKGAIGLGLSSLLSPAVGALISTWGTEGLAMVLDTWTADTITDVDIATDLAKKGYKVVPYDPKTLWGVPVPPV